MAALMQRSRLNLMSSLTSFGLFGMPTLHWVLCGSARLLVRQASIAYRRSLRAVRTVEAGEVITVEDVRSVRPAGGLSPDEIDVVIGMRAVRRLEQGAPVTWSDVRTAEE